MNFPLQTKLSRPFGVPGFCRFLFQGLRMDAKVPLTAICSLAAGSVWADTNSPP